jgi:hypothetical protein
MGTTDQVASDDDIDRLLDIIRVSDDARDTNSGRGLRTPVNMPEPTSALPGTREKVEVLTDRARRGQVLWHPQDAGMMVLD